MPDPYSAFPCRASGSRRFRTLRRCIAPVALTMVLLFGCNPAGTAVDSDATAQVAIAAHGFARPESIASSDGVFGRQVAVAAGPDGPIALWQDRDGLRSKLLPAGPNERFVTSRGVRDVWAGAAGGDRLVAWAERDLRSGRTSLMLRWRGETRNLLTSVQRPLATLVSGSKEPELMIASPTPDGWIFTLHSWDGTVRRGPGRSLTVASLDARRRGSVITLAWIEGSDEQVFGRPAGSWSAYLVRWEDRDAGPGQAIRLGAARHDRDADVVRLGSAAEGEVAWPAADGALLVRRGGATAVVLGQGTLIGHLAGRWTWLDDRLVRQLDASGKVLTVLRLPSPAEHVAAAYAASTVGIVWSSGRYLGGLEVWAVTDTTPYRDSRLERLALAMGFDPWRPYQAAGGQLLIALLAALLLASSMTPAWWLTAWALARRSTTSSRQIALEGALVGVVVPVLTATLMAVRIEAIGGPAIRLLVGPGWLAAGIVGGVSAALVTLRTRDLDGALGRLLAAWISGFVLSLILAFGTFGAWQRALGSIG